MAIPENDDTYLDRLLTSEEAAGLPHILNLDPDVNVRAIDQQYLSDAYKYYLGGGRNVPSGVEAGDPAQIPGAMDSLVATGDTGIVNAGVTAPIGGNTLEQQRLIDQGIGVQLSPGQPVVAPGEIPRTQAELDAYNFYGPSREYGDPMDIGYEEGQVDPQLAAAVGGKDTTPVVDPMDLYSGAADEGYLGVPAGPTDYEFEAAQERQKTQDLANLALTGPGSELEKMDVHEEPTSGLASLGSAAKTGIKLLADVTGIGKLSDVLGIGLTTSSVLDLPNLENRTESAQGIAGLTKDEASLINKYQGENQSPGKDSEGYNIISMAEMLNPGQYEANRSERQRVRDERIKQEELAQEESDRRVAEEVAFRELQAKHEALAAAEAAAQRAQAQAPPPAQPQGGQGGLQDRGGGQAAADRAGGSSYSSPFKHGGPAHIYKRKGYVSGGIVDLL